MIYLQKRIASDLIFAGKWDTAISNHIHFSETVDDCINTTAKIRYGASESEATIIPIENNIKVEFKKPQRAITPGQSVVFYDNDIVIGGGIIS